MNVDLTGPDGIPKSCMIRGMSRPFGIYDVLGAGLMRPERYRNLFAYAEFGLDGVKEVDKHVRTTGTWRGNNTMSKVYNLLGVQYFLVPPGEEISNEDLKLIYTGDMDIYKNRHTTHRTFLVHNHIVGTDKIDVFRLFDEESFNHEQTVILEDRPNLQDYTMGDDHGDVPDKEFSRIISYSPNEIDIECLLKTNGFLILTDPFFPGWKATDNGQPVKIWPAYYALRAIPVGPGYHNIKMYFEPQYYQMTLLISKLTGILCILTVILLWLRGRKKRNGIGGG